MGAEIQIYSPKNIFVFNLKICVLFSDQMNGLDRVPGSMIVVCSQPPQSSTTSVDTNSTAITTPDHLPSTTTATITSTTVRSTQAYISTTELTSLPLTSVSDFTSTVFITGSATTVNNDTVTVRQETEHSENRGLAHFPCTWVSHIIIV